MLGVAAVLSALILTVPGAPQSAPVGQGPSPVPIAADAGASPQGTGIPSPAVHLSVSGAVRAPAAIDPKGCVPRWRCG